MKYSKNYIKFRKYILLIKLQNTGSGFFANEFKKRKLLKEIEEIAEKYYAEEDVIEKVRMYIFEKIEIFNICIPKREKWKYEYLKNIYDLLLII